MADGGSFGTQLWETPIGRVVKGMDAVHKFYSGYGDMPPWGKGPVQGNIRAEGIGYMQENFPLTDAFLECQVHRSRKAPPEAAAGKYPDPKVHEQQHRRPGGEAEHPHNNIRTTAQQQQHSKKERQHAGEHHHQEHHHQQQHQQPSHHNVLNPVDGEAAQQQQQHVGGELHHQHSVHFNAAPNEEGLTKLSWELVGSCLILFLGVFCLWLRIALRGAPSKSRKTS